MPAAVPIHVGIRTVIVVAFYEISGPIVIVASSNSKSTLIINFTILHEFILKAQHH